MQPTLTDLSDMARKAGEILRSGFGQQHQVVLKGEMDLVTEIDHQSEEFIVGEINRRFPSQHIFAEERGEQNGTAATVWYVDPLDGTLNYSHGLAIFSVSIAYAHQGQLSLATVYDPMADEMFTAQRGKGAWLNGQPIRVSKVSALKSSLLVTGFPYDAWTNPVNNFAEFRHFSMLTQGVRRLGSAALDLSYVAAGGLIVQEAGGLATDILGRSDFLSKPQSILAANPDLHAVMLAELRESEIARALG